MILRRPIHPLWGLVEIAGLTGFFFFGLWILGPQIATEQVAGSIYWVLILACAVYLFWISPRMLHCDPPEWRGWGAPGPDGERPGAFSKAWKVNLLFTGIAASLLLMGTWWLEPGRLVDIQWKSVGVKFIYYVVFGTVQAALFFGFMMNRIRKMIPEGDGEHSARIHRFQVALLTASLFALFHLPNQPLMGISLAGGFCWSWIYYRWPNLLLIGVGHAILGTILHRVSQLYMRIGPFYEQSDLYILRTVVPGLKQAIGNLY